MVINEMPFVVSNSQYSKVSLKSMACIKSRHNQRNGQGLQRLLNTFQSIWGG